MRKTMGIVVSFLIVTATLAACGSTKEEMQTTVSHQVAAAAKATNEARPTLTAYPTATGYPIATPYPTLASWPTATPQPAASPYPTVTKYPTHTPLPTPTATETPKPLPTGNSENAPAASQGSVNIELEILRVISEARQKEIVLFGQIGQNPDCHQLVSAYDQMVIVRELDVAGAAPVFQSAYQYYRERIDFFVGPSATKDMANRCRELLSQGQSHGQFNQAFFKSAELEFLLDKDLAQALRSIGGE